MKKETIHLRSATYIDIPMSFISQESSKLMVLLPGVGYTVDSPLFHYLRIVGANQGYDILSVKYGFQVTGSSGGRDSSYEDSRAAIDMVWQARHDSLCIVGKSFGTPLASRLIHELDVANKSLILLTPIGNAAADSKGIPTLAIIGTKDHYYDPSIINHTPSVEWQVFDGLNHSLEVKGDWRVSLQKMAEMMVACETFLESL